MTIEALTPMLRTWQLRTTVDFYVEVLGFSCEALDEEMGWASLRRDNAALMLSGPNEQEGDVAPVFTGSLYLRTDDVDALWQHVKDRARVCYPIEDFEYGMREFAIYDNNGYLLQFGQPLPGSE
jgi:uncharacterized glyoxalase superfamily protein PhnB